MKILDGQKLANKIETNLKKKIAKNNLRPGLAVILIGKNPSSIIYTKLKEKFAKRINVNFKKISFSYDVTQIKILKLIEQLNKDKAIHGIIVQMPLPKKLNASKIVAKISPFKDIDGFHSKTKFVSPVHQAIIELIKSTNKSVKNKKFVILSKNPIFVRPLVKLFEEKQAQSLYKSLTHNIKQLTKDFKKIDILVSALGIPKIIKPAMLKNNSIIIDVGFTRRQQKIFGDVDTSEKTSNLYLSPVPGGVGPLTIAYLFKNLLISSSKSLQNFKK
ncbi:bifunctional 5,10-methylenetetrahydrofolate dehydrogenase/5,10-methenyltetrahydrofolate cyclohydrolase [Patescibacteria group bacterium]|nr:bifunctional 5,10-methylenetetrahydrofolate dehydrogenase/5,10-methenyltetrahydrofolate cyclohydrolase [Patescibacteria group bacterium]